MRCPKCFSEETVSGKLSSRDTVHFVPDGLKHFAWTFADPKVALGSPGIPGIARRNARAFACQGCGLVWSVINTKDLANVLEKWKKKPEDKD